jgi:hypothetical protein
MRPVIATASKVLFTAFLLAMAVIAPALQAQGAAQPPVPTNAPYKDASLPTEKRVATCSAA